MSFHVLLTDLFFDNTIITYFTLRLSLKKFVTVTAAALYINK